MRFSSLFFLFLFSKALTGQCDGVYRLCSQSDVDSFFIKNGFCEEVNRLIIGDGPNNCLSITDLTPLLGIKRIDNFFLKEMPNCPSLDGLDSLQSVGDFRISATSFSDLNGLRNLKHIDFLNHVYFDSDIYDGIDDLSMYGNDLLRITEGLEIDFDTKLSGNSKILIPSQSENPDFILNLRFTSAKNDFTELIRQDIKDFPRLVIQSVDSDSLSLKGLENIESYITFSVIRTEDLDLSPVNHLTAETLAFVSFSNDNNFQSFANVRDLKNLTIIDYNGLSSIHNLLPELQEVSNFFQILNNEDLTDISALNDLELPHKTIIDNSSVTGPYNIMVTDNPNLDSCNLDLFCRALHEYPDSILIANNGIGCTLEEVKRYCQTVSTDDLVDKEINLFPNPANGFVNITSESTIQKIELLDTTGKLIQVKNSHQTSINIDAYPPGTYIMRIYTENSIFHERFIIESL